MQSLLHFRLSCLSPVPSVHNRDRALTSRSRSSCAPRFKPSWELSPRAARSSLLAAPPTPLVPLRSPGRLLGPRLYAVRQASRTPTHAIAVATRGPSCCRKLPARTLLFSSDQLGSPTTLSLKISPSSTPKPSSIVPPRSALPSPPAQVFRFALQSDPPLLARSQSAVLPPPSPSPRQKAVLPRRSALARERKQSPAAKGQRRSLLWLPVASTLSASESGHTIDRHPKPTAFHAELVPKTQQNPSALDLI